MGPLREYLLGLFGSLGRFREPNKVFGDGFVLECREHGGRVFGSLEGHRLFVLDDQQHIVFADVFGADGRRAVGESSIGTHGDSAGGVALEMFTLL